MYVCIIQSNPERFPIIFKDVGSDQKNNFYYVDHSVIKEKKNGCSIYLDLIENRNIYCGMADCRGIHIA